MVNLGKKSKIRPSAKGVFFFCTIALSFYVLMGLPRVAIPFAISYLINLAIGPFVPSLIKFGLSRVQAVGLILVSLGLVMAYPLAKLVPNLARESKNFQYYLPKMETYIQKTYGEVSNVIHEKTGQTLDPTYLETGVEFAKNSSQKVLLAVPKILAMGLEWAFLVPLFLFFLLRDGKSFKFAFLKLCPNSIFERFYSLSTQFQKKLGGYIFAKLIEATIVGGIILIGLLVMDIRFAFLFAVIAALTNIIPYVGPVIGAVPALAVTLAEYGTGAELIAVGVLFAVANIIDLAIVFPLLVSKIVDLHPLLVVVSVIVGSQYFGVLGMVISIPVAAAFKLVIQEVYNEVYSADA